jgi:hypothetical protein
MNIIFPNAPLVLVGSIAYAVFVLASSPAIGDEFPYSAVVTGDHVNVRSGPDTSYYAVTRLGKNDSITVEGFSFGWAKIRPPKGTFSCIKKSDVTASPDGRSGHVAGSAAYVYAAGELASPKRLFSVQAVLKESAEVSILGDMDGYWKIEPPSDARLWISARYIAKGTPRLPTQKATPAVTVAPTPRPKPRIAGEIARLESKLKVELKRPLREQSLQPFIDQFRELSKKAAKEDEVLSAYSREWASILQQRLADKEILRQGKKIADEITEMRIRFESELRQATATLDSPPPPKYALIGRLEESYVFTGRLLEKWYLIVDPDSGSSSGYVRVPSDAEVDPEAFLGKTVGVMGKSQYDAEKEIYVVTVEKLEPLTATSTVETRRESP